MIGFDRAIQDVDINDIAADHLDIFHRLRVSQPETIFDSKQLFDKLPLFWDESITDNSGNATSTHSTSDASTTMHVESDGAGSDDTIIRQTKTHWAYQPGKGQLVLMTGRLEEGGGAAGVLAEIGCGTAVDGLFFQQDGTTTNVVVRKASSDTDVAQSSWNVDKLDGTGASGKTLDISKANIYFISFEWLGVGDVVFGVFFDRMPVICHILENSNALTSVYMSTPNLPVRYRITTTSGSNNGNMEHICSTVISEGGRTDSGITHAHTTNGTGVAGTTGNLYAVLGVKLKSTHLDAMVRPIHSTTLATTKDDSFEWFICVNPTIAGTFTYGDVTNSAVQLARGATANTITAGSWDIVIAAGLGSTAAPFTGELDSDLYLGSQIDGTPDEFVLAYRPLTNTTLHGTLECRELW